MKTQRPIKASTTVYISNLSYGRDEKGLTFIFSKYGKVKNINLVIDLDTKQSKGMAFVEMSSLEESKRAIEGLNLHLLDGRTLKAKYAIPMRADSPNPFAPKIEKKFAKKVEAKLEAKTEKKVVKKVEKYVETRIEKNDLKKILRAKKKASRPF
jgi:RNA recognition motif-containing protein